MDGNKKFTDNGTPLNYSLNEFWEWYASDLMHGPLRGAVAEYIIAQALGIDCSSGRNLWAAYDLEYQGHSIEVKSSAYLQKKEHLHLSKRLTFSIDTHKHGAETKHHAELYIFCLIHCKDEAMCDPMDLSQWTFYILPTVEIEKLLGNKRTMSFRTLVSLNPTIASYKSLKQGIDEVCKNL